MKRWSVSIIFFLSLLLFFFPIDVSGKGILKKCYYSSTYDGISKKSLMVNVTIYDDYSSKAIIEKYAGKSKNNSEKILNWADYKDNFKNNKECPDTIYAVINFGINGAKVWYPSKKYSQKYKDALVAYTSDKRDQLIEESKSEELKEKEEQTKQDVTDYLNIVNNDDYYKVVVDATNKLKELIERYKSGECIDDSDITGKYKDCKTLINNLETHLNSYNDKINGYINDGNIDENDNRTIEYKEAAEEAKQVIQNARYLFEQYSEYWNSQMGLSDEYIEEPVFENQFLTLEQSTGCDVFGKDTTRLIKWAYSLIKYGAPILVVILGILDFARAFLSGEDKGFKEAWQRFIKRLIAAVVVILLPVLITFILDLSGVLKQYDIEGEGNEIYCIFK